MSLLAQPLLARQHGPLALRGRLLAELLPDDADCFVSLSTRFFPHLLTAHEHGGFALGGSLLADLGQCLFLLGETLAKRFLLLGASHLANFLDFRISLADLFVEVSRRVVLGLARRRRVSREL